MDTNKRILSLIDLIIVFVISYSLVRICFKLGIIDAQIPITYKECVSRYWIGKKYFNYWDTLIFGGGVILLLSFFVEKKAIGFYFFGGKKYLYNTNINTRQEKIKALVNTFLFAVVYIVIWGLVFRLIDCIVGFPLEQLFSYRSILGINNLMLRDIGEMYIYQWIIDLNIMLYVAIGMKWFYIEKFTRRTKYYLVESTSLLALLFIIVFINAKIEYSDPLYLYDQAINEYKNGNYTNATKYADKAIKIRPKLYAANFDSLYLIRGLSHLALNNHKMAISDFFAYGSSSGYSTYLYNLLSSCYYTIGDMNMAKVSLDSAINYIPYIKNIDFKSNKELLWLYYRRAYIEYTLKLYSLSIKDLDYAIRNDSSNRDFFYMRGECMRETGHSEDAIRDYNRAIKIDSSHPPSYIGIGKSLLALDKQSDALVYFNRAINIFPSPEAYMNKYFLEKKMNNRDWIEDSIIYDVLKRQETILQRPNRQ